MLIGKISREGLIIEYPINGLFHDPRNIILMSQMAISEVVANVGNDVKVIYGKTMVGKPLFFGKITTSNEMKKK